MATNDLEYSPTPAVRNLRFDLSNDFGKLPHPLGKLLDSLENFRDHSLEEIVNFLLFLGELKSQEEIFRFCQKQSLALCFARLQGGLKQLAGRAVRENRDLAYFQELIIEYLLQSRARIGLMNKLFYRVQGENETFSQYVEDIRSYAEAFQVDQSEAQIVGNIMDGMSPKSRSSKAYIRK